MGSYAKGRRLEYRVKRVLESWGYFVVRCAGSKPVDLVAIKDGKAILVEVKSRNYLKPDEREKLRKIQETSGAEIWLAFPGDDVGPQIRPFLP